MKKLLTFIFLIFSFGAFAEMPAREKVKIFYESLAGVSPSRQEVEYLLPSYQSGNLVQMGRNIVDPDGANINNYGSFYSVTVKNFASPWSNEDGSTLVPLNDLSATVIGYTRDEQPFHGALYEDAVYTPNGVGFRDGSLIYFPYNSDPNTYPQDYGVTNPASQPSVVCAGVTGLDSNPDKMLIYHQDLDFPNDPDKKKCQATKYTYNELGDHRDDPTKRPFIDSYYHKSGFYLPKYDLALDTNLIKSTNAQYESVEANSLDYSDPDLFIKKSQLVRLHQYSEAISGLLTTRSYGVFYTAGTNRAPFAFSMRNFFCKDMEELNDTTIPDFRNRRDIDRSPGGTSSIYKNRCIGCHAGMDAMAGAFAYYDYNGALNYTPMIVHPKMNHNVIFTEGFVTQSDSWINLWNQGKNASLGWGTTMQGNTSGNGVKSLAQMFASSDAFNTCMSKQVADLVCYKVKSHLDSAVYQNIIETNAASFASDGNMKMLFINTAIACMEQL